MAQDTVARVLEELDKIYSEENLQKDKFFKELIEQHPEGWVSLKKFSAIKRFKTLVNGDLNLFVQAAEQSQGRYEVNEDKTKLRKLPEEESEEDEETNEADAQQVTFEEFLQTTNRRSIYAKGFPQDPAPSKEELREYFAKHGRVLSLKLRMDGDKFKGSVFVEYESPEIANEIVLKDLEYNGQELLVMTKKEYVEMKAREKFQGVEWKNDNKNKKLVFLVEFEGGQNMKVDEIRKLVEPKAQVTWVQWFKKEGRAVLQLGNKTPDAFLASLGEDKKIGNLTFRLPDDQMTKKFFEARKSGKRKGGRHPQSGRDKRQRKQA